MYICTLLRKKHLTDPDALTGKVGLPIYIDTYTHIGTYTSSLVRIVKQLNTIYPGNVDETVGKSWYRTIKLLTPCRILLPTSRNG